MKFIIIGLVCLGLLIVFGLYIYLKRAQKPNVAFFLNYLKEHPNTTAITLVHNGEVLVGSHQDRPMPLASTVKIIIAIEYARQAGAGLIQPDEKVKLQTIEKYYMANFDGNAHNNWLKDVEKKQLSDDGYVALKEVVIGMIRFSSNANTEYMMERLGLENINTTLRNLGLANHEPLFPFVSSLLIPYELMQKHTTLSYKKALEKAKEEFRLLSSERYNELASEIHSKLKQDQNGAYKLAANIKK